MKVLSTCDILLILSVINLSFSQFHSRYQHKVRSRRNNRPRHGNISPRILNKDTPIVSDGFHSPPQFQQQASRRIDIVSEASFVPSKTVNFDPDFQSIEESDFHTSETEKKPVVFRNERLSNPLQFKSSKNSGWNGQNISKYSAKGSETDQTIGEKSNSNEETIMTLLRENPRRYIFWPEDTSNKPYINDKTIENNVQEKVDIAEDRIWTGDSEKLVGDLTENVFLFPEVENKSILGEIKAEPITLTTTFDEEFDNDYVTDDDRMTDDDKEALPAINDPPMKIESFFDQLSNKNSVIKGFNSQFSNEGSFRVKLSNTSTTTSTTTSSTTTRATSTTTTRTTTTTTTTTTTITSTPITYISTSTTTKITPTTTATTTSDTTTKTEFGIEGFFGQLQEASSSALKSDESSDKVLKDQEEVFLGTRIHNETLIHVVNNSLLSRDQNQHHQAGIIETSSLNITDTNLAPGSQNDVKFAENNNTVVNLEEEEIRTTIQDLVEETTVFTITNDSTPVPVVSVTTMTPMVISEAETFTSSTVGSVTRTVTRRLPSRYRNTRTRTPSKTRPSPSPASTRPPSVINHNMNLQTALIINTLSKVLPNVPQSRLKNQPRLESVGSGVTFHQEEIFIFHTTLTELHAILDKSLRKGGLPSDLMVSIFAAKEHTIALVHLFYRLLLEAEFRQDKSVTISKVDSRDFAKHFHFLRAIFPFL